MNSTTATALGAVHLLPIVAAIVTAVAMYFYIGTLKRFNVYDIPNARSSHSRPLPTGGGWIVILVAFGAWCLTIPLFKDVYIALIVATLVLATVSWFDDLWALSPMLRLVVQLGAVCLMLSYIEQEQRILLDGLPFWADRITVAIAWIWFVNLFNFMDGIDGIASIEVICVGLGIGLVGYLSNFDSSWLWLSVLVAASALGFLVWNWFPAKILLGDVGSVSLGFVLGWLLIQLALSGHLIPALILPLYFVADATITLVRRIMSGEPFWEPHRKHFYQCPAVSGVPHSHVSIALLIVNILLVSAAVLALYNAAFGAIIAVVAVAALLNYLRSIS